MTKGNCASPWKNYIYDDQGKAQFVKVYMNPQQQDRTHTTNNTPLSLDLLLQQDQAGTYLAVPIRKHRQNDDDDGDYWICPHCGRKNPASRNSCSTKGCPFYGKS